MQREHPIDPKIQLLGTQAWDEIVLKMSPSFQTDDFCSSETARFILQS